MAVNVQNLDRVVRQAIETWVATAKHDLGYTVTDRSTGKRYRYCLYSAQSATAVPGSPAGVLAGAGSANGVTTNTTVTTDSATALYRVIGVFRGTPTDTYYGWIEMIDKAIPTTVRVDCSDVIVQGTYLQWTTDAELDSLALATCTSAELGLIVGRAAESCVADDFATVHWI